MTIAVSKRGNNSTQIQSVILAPSFPLDAKIKNVAANGKKIMFEMKPNGDGQQTEIKFEAANSPMEISFDYAEGTDVYLVPPSLVAGAENVGLRVVKAQARKDGLFLMLEGRGGKNYELNYKSPQSFKEVEGVKITTSANGEKHLQISFVGDENLYIRREILLPFAAVR